MIKFFVIGMSIAFVLGITHQVHSDITPYITSLTREYALYQKQVRDHNNRSIASWEDFRRVVIAMAHDYDMNPAVPLAQAAHESGRGTSYLARHCHNYFGLGAYSDNTPCMYFENPVDSIQYYMHLIAEQYKNAYAVRNNPAAMIKKIQEGGYAQDPEYINRIMQQPEFIEFAKM